VVDAIGRDQAEVLVTGAPTRPFLAIGAVFPRLAERLLRTTGVAQLSQNLARRRNRA
jgi:hypothetical protein